MSPAGTLKITTPSDTELAMTRAFDAPRHLVYAAFTTPALVKRWLGAMEGYTMPVCEIDLRVGGSYRYEWRAPSGGVMGMGGVYREIVPMQRIVSTERFDQSWYEGDGLDTVTFEEKDGRTIVTTTVKYVSKAVRDSVLKSPMEHGVAAGYDKLDQVLEQDIHSTLTAEKGT